MKPVIASPYQGEIFIEEGCFILESWNHPTDLAVSVARARVAPRTQTRWHYLDVDERYLITQGSGVMELGGLSPARVRPGHVVLVPAGCTQRIRNDHSEDLVFYCVCTPRFEPRVYHAVDGD